ncbi:MAG: response regulator transcription factor [Spirochaetales bacterium]|nr:response regulator transcription factor [Spirochaetales bacterium]
MRIKIIVADDHRLMREGLLSLLAKEPEIEVVGKASDGHEVIRKTEILNPDIIIMDITMPGLNGIDTTGIINERFPEVKIIALSMHAHARFISGILEAGASGYLLKDCAFEELIAAVHMVYEGRMYLSPSITDVVVRDYVRQKSKTAGTAGIVLSIREREVLQLIAEGKSTKEIAAILYLSPKTVETHKRNIMEKTRISSIPELVKYAIGEGITSVDN